ncbi:MAG: hypothetical protein ACK45Z_13460, partial [Dolichospermum sp.]
LNIYCDYQSWKLSVFEFNKIEENYKGELMGSKKMPDGKRIMSYKIEDISEAEAFAEECTKFVGFTGYFASL